MPAGSSRGPRNPFTRYGIPLGSRAAGPEKPKPVTTLAVGEEGAQPPRPDVTTLAVGEEGSGRPPGITTLAVGEEGS